MTGLCTPHFVSCRQLFKPLELLILQTLPQIWEELRRKDERVTELEAELLLTPNRLGSTLGSTPTTPNIPEHAGQENLECQVRELQERLEEKELQVIQAPPVPYTDVAYLGVADSSIQLEVTIGSCLGVCRSSLQLVPSCPWDLFLSQGYSGIWIRVVN